MASMASSLAKARQTRSLQRSPVKDEMAEMRMRLAQKEADRIAAGNAAHSAKLASIGPTIVRARARVRPAASRARVASHLLAHDRRRAAL